MNQNNSNELVKIAHHAMDIKMAEDIRIIKISDISVIADYFIIANGTNDSQVRALVENVEETLSKEGFEPKQREGYGLGSWVLLDFGNIIVHVFDKENRLFYDLERIWRDGKAIDKNDL